MHTCDVVISSKMVHKGTVDETVWMFLYLELWWLHNDMLHTVNTQIAPCLKYTWYLNLGMGLIHMGVPTLICSLFLSYNQSIKLPRTLLIKSWYLFVAMRTIQDMFGL